MNLATRTALGLAGATLVLALLVAAPARADTPVSGDITTDTAWSALHSPYVVTGDVTVRGFDGADGVTKLTLDPGVVVRFMPGTKLTLGDGLAEPGALAANGTQEAPIVFTSARDAPAPGDWGGIVFTSTADDELSFVQRAIVEYATDLVVAQESAPTIADSTLRNASGFAIVGQGRWAAPRVVGNSFADVVAPVRTSPWGAGAVGLNAWETAGPDQAVHVFAERIEADTRWDDAGTPFVLDGVVTIAGEHGDDGVTTLTIGPGVQLNLTRGTSIEVGECCDQTGALAALGTAEAPVRFTSHEPEGAKTAGFWDRIHVYGAARDDATVLEGVILESAGASGRGALHANASSPTLRQSVIRNNAGPALHAETTSAWPVAAGNEFRDNAPAHALLQPDGVRFFTGNTFPAGGEVRVQAGTLARDAAWTHQGVPYNLTGTLAIAGWDGPDARTGLELLEGVTLQFPQDALILGTYSTSYSSYYGYLNASGTAQAPVTLTSWSASKAAGQWGGVRLGPNAERGVLSHLVVEAAGGGQLGALYLHNGAPSALQNVTIRQSAAHGLYLDCPASPALVDVRIEASALYGIYQQDYFSTCTPTFERVTIEGSGERPLRLSMQTPRGDIALVDNAIREIELYTGSLMSSTTLELRADRDSGERYAYSMLSTLSVLNDSVLTIDAGVAVRFAPSTSLSVGTCCSASQYYRGTLVARGTAELPVVLEARDTSARWNGVYLEGYGHSPDLPHELVNVTIAGSADDGLHLRRVTSGLYDNVTLADNARYGLLLDESTTTWRSLTAARNGNAGVWVGWSTRPVFLGGLFEGNGGYGIYAAYSNAGATVDGAAFRNQTGRPARVRLDDVFLPSDLAGNTVPQVEHWTFDLYSSRTITRLASSDGVAYAHSMLGGFTVRNDATLTLEPGVTVLFGDQDALNVGICCSSTATYRGTLVAAGTEELPIVIGGVSDTARWYGVYLEGYGLNPDPPHVLRNVTIERTRDDGLHLRRITNGVYDNVTSQNNARFGVYLQDSGNVAFMNAKLLDNADIGFYLDGVSRAKLDAPLIRNNGRWGVYMPGGGDFVTMNDAVIEDMRGRPYRVRVDDEITGTILRNNSQPEIELWGANVLRNVTLARQVDEVTGAVYDYGIVSYVTIQSNRTLTVEPGLTLRFDGEAGIRLGGCCTAGTVHQGALLAEGTEELPIRFLNRTPVATNSWYGVEVDGSVSVAARNPSALRNVTIEGSRANGLHVLRMGVGTWDNITSQNNLHSGIIFNTGASAHLQGYRGVANAQYGNLRVRDNAVVTVADALLADAGDHGLYLEHDASTAYLSNVTIEDSAQYGIWGAGVWGGRADMDRVHIAGSGARAWRLSPWSHLGDVTLEGNAIRELEWLRGDVGADRAWPLFTDAGGAYTYVGRDGVRFFDGATLTIEPGVTVEFLQNAWMDIGWCCHSPNTRNRASLLAEGTQELPIRLAGQTGDRATGWYGLLLQGDGIVGDGATVLRNVTIAHSKDDALQVHAHDNATLDNVTLVDAARFGLYASSAYGPTVRGLLVEDTANHGLYTDGSAAFDVTGALVRGSGGYGVYHGTATAAGRYADLRIEDAAGAPLRVRLDTDLPGLALSGNALGKIELWAADVTTERALPLVIEDGDAYDAVILGSFTIRAGGRLTVPAGSEVLMPQDQRIHVGLCCWHDSRDPGALVAAGTEEAPISFGATTGNKTTGWRGLYFDGRSNYGEMQSVLRNVTLRDSRADLVDLFGHQSVTMDRLTLIGATSSGVYSHGVGRLEITNSRFDGGNHGAYVVDTPATLVNNTFLRVATAALYMERAHGSAVSESTLVVPGATAIRLVDTDNGDLRRNRVTGSALGIRIESSSANNLLADNVWSNDANALDLSTTTRWNITPTLGANVCGGPTLAGNCWSDYLGEDTGNDGVGDTILPYKVNISGPGDLAPLVLRPYADFASEIVNATEGLVQFHDLSTDPLFPIVNWTWEFGDGGVAYEQNPLHDYDLEGLFTAKLTIRDSGGIGANVTRTVLLDTLPPTSTGLLAGSLGEAGWFVSNVTVTLAADDDESAVSEILFRLDGLGDFVTYEGPFDVGAEGITRLEYYAVDLGGNAEPTRTLDIPIDLTAPVTTPALDGTLHGVGWYTSNVTATLAATDATSGANATFFRLDGSDVAVYDAPIVIEGTGEHALDPFSKDVAGNLETPLRALVRIDLTPPTSALDVTGSLPGENGWWRSAVDVGLVASDLGAGVAGMAIGVDGAPVAPYTSPVALAAEGVHEVQHQATDLVDLVETLRSSLVKIDPSAPAVGIDLVGDLHASGWYRTPVTAYVNASDPTSGVNATEYALDSPGFRAYTGPLAIATTGTHSLAARASDLAGNLEELAALTLPVDVTPPSTSHTVVSGTRGTGHWYRSDVQSRLSAVDGVGSGVAGTTYVLDDASPLTYVSGTDITITGEGLHRLNATSTDVVGHVEALKSFLVGIDLTPPASVANVTGQQNEANGAYYEPVTVRLLASDALSGVQRIEYWIDGVGPKTYSATKPLRIEEPGVYNITYRALDLALNAEPTNLLSIVLEFDLTPPDTDITVEGVQGIAPWYRSPVEVTLASVDAGAGVGLIEYSLDGANWTAYDGTFTLDRQAKHALRYRATDLVGNIETPKLADIGVDTSAPATTASVEGPAGENGWYAGPVNVTLGAVDSVSAIHSLRYRLNGSAWTDVPSVLRINTSGQHVLEWMALDLAGNPAGGNLSLKIDFDLPTAVSNVTGEAGNGTWFRSGVLIELDADDLTSGIAHIEYSIDGGAWVPYVGPIELATEGNHTVRYAPLDLVGNRGLEVLLEISIDLTTPIVSIEIDEELHLIIDETIVVRNRLCIHVSGLDLLSGLNTLVIHVVGQVTKIVEIDLGVNYQCVELPDGAYEVRLIGCDHAGWCRITGFPFVVDNGPPLLWLVRPTPGSVMVQNVSAPVFRTIFGHDRTALYADVAGIPESPVELPELPERPPWPEDFPVASPFDENGWPTGTPLRDPRDGDHLNATLMSRNDTLARTTVVFGPRVPIWISAWDATGVVRVDFELDGIPIGTALKPQRHNLTTLGIEQRNLLDERGPLHVHAHQVELDVYVVTIDTLGMIAGTHNVTVRAMDLLGAESVQTFSFIFQSGQNFENVAEDVAQAIEQVDMTMAPEGAVWRDWIAANLRFFGPLLDQNLQRDYVFLDRGLMEHEGVYDPIIAAPGLAYADEGWYI